MGVPFWGIVIYLIVFVAGYFVWAIKKITKGRIKWN